jgi:hypothetical protein
MEALDRDEVAEWLHLPALRSHPVQPSDLPAYPSVRVRKMRAPNVGFDRLLLNSASFSLNMAYYPKYHTFSKILFFVLSPSNDLEPVCSITQYFLLPSLSVSRSPDQMG